MITGHWEWPAPQALPDLIPGQVHIWAFDTESVATSTRAALSSYLSADEVAQAAAYRFQRDRQRSKVRRGALRALLGGYVGIGPADLAFSYGPQGKPVLNERRGSLLSFNVARAEGLALYAVARHARVGVDLERIRPIPEMDSILARCAESEQKQWRALKARQRLPAFFRCWVLKEAYLKATGQGLTGALDGFAVLFAGSEPARLLCVRGDGEAPGRWMIETFDVLSGYLGAVACDGAGTVERFALEDALLRQLASTSEQRGAAQA